MNAPMKFKVTGQINESFGEKVRPCHIVEGLDCDGEKWIVHVPIGFDNLYIVKESPLTAYMPVAAIRYAISDLRKPQ